MEQVRVVLAVVLSVLVLFVWQALFAPHPPANTPEPQEKKAEKAVFETGREPAAQAVEKEGGFDKAGKEDQGGFVEEEEQTPSPPVSVETDLYMARISGKGARITSFVLKNYRETKAVDSPFKELVSEKNPLGTVGLAIGDGGLSGVDTGAYLTEEIGDVVVKNGPRKITWTKRFENGVVVEKSYTFVPGSYLIDLEVSVENRSLSEIPGTLGVTLEKYFEDIHERRFVFEGPCALVGGRDLKEIAPKEIGKKGTVSGPLDWVSIQTRYFMAAVVPQKVSDAVMKTAIADDHLVSATYLSPADPIEPGGSRKYGFKVFMGPKSVSILNKAGYNLDRAVDFGMFDFLARPCLWLMNLIYRFIPNYGVAIIVLTILFKVIFWPLGNKSYKSMADMKRLQPLMAEIREKYKNDRKKMNEEVMNLYRTYKINPLGGCLPILVQIPVFFAFYRMLYQAIELRHAPFFLWIDDLSAPDRLFRFDVAIPFMAPPVGIPVLTLVMGLTMIVQQKLQPPAGDPTQAKMMMLMPVIFTFIFINFPSGLVLYWLVNNIISIFQQYYITRKSA